MMMMMVMTNDDDDDDDDDENVDTRRSSSDRCQSQILVENRDFAPRCLRLNIAGWRFGLVVTRWLRST